MDKVRLRTIYEYNIYFIFIFYSYYPLTTLRISTMIFETFNISNEQNTHSIKFNEKYMLCLCCLVTTEYGSRDILADMSISDHFTQSGIFAGTDTELGFSLQTLFLIFWIIYITRFCFMINSALILRRINERSGPQITIP